MLDSRHSRPMLPGTTVPDMSQPAGDQVQRALAQFGQVRGLVFGQYGEWSHDVSSLVSLAVSVICHRLCDNCHRLSHDLARNALGCCAGRSRSGARHQRVPAVEGDRPVVTPPTVRLLSREALSTFVGDLKYGLLPSTLHFCCFKRRIETRSMPLAP